MARKIYEESWWYYRVKFLADRYIRSSFSKLVFEGKERIPKDGAVIFAPNHCDALMDPLAVLTMRNEHMVFVARADIFKGKKTGRLLNFLKIMPINRRRDGILNMTKAEDTIRKSIEVLVNKVKFCILPEGRHRPMHGLLPIGKGVARVAYGTYQQVGPDYPVYIVPVGLEYGDYYRYRSTLLVQVGDPINVTEHILSHPDRNGHDIMQDIRSMVAERLSEKIVCISDEDNYDAIWEISKMMSGRISASDLKMRFDANREAVSRIERFAHDNPEQAQALFDEVLEFKEVRKKARISINTVNKRHPAGSWILNTILSVLFLPMFLVYATASLPVWVTCEAVTSRLKDKAFANSIRMLILLVMWTLLYIVWAVVLFCNLKWWVALIAALLLQPAAIMVYDYFELVRMTLSDWRYMFNGEVRARYRKILNKIHKIR